MRWEHLLMQIHLNKETTEKKKKQRAKIRSSRAYKYRTRNSLEVCDTNIPTSLQSKVLWNELAPNMFVFNLQLFSFFTKEGYLFLDGLLTRRTLFAHNFVECRLDPVAIPTCKLVS